MKTQQLIRDFLRMQTDTLLDPIMASLGMRDVWGISIDWHEFTEALEYLVRSGDAEHAGHSSDRMSLYLIR